MSLDSAYAFLLMFDSNLWPRSFKNKCHAAIGLSVCPFPSMNNSNILSNSAPLRDVTLRNLSDLELDLSMSLKVICDNVIGLSIYAFLLMFDSNLWPNCAP